MRLLPISIPGLCLTLALVAAPARADDQVKDLDIAKAHYTTGQDYFAAGRYQSSVKEFLEAYRLSHKPLLLFNIALCYEKLDDPGRVTTYYRQYLRDRPDAAERRDVEEKLAGMAPRVATAAVRTADGAEVWVDGELVGKAPVGEVLLTEGRHHLEAHFADHAPTIVDQTLPGGRVTELVLEPKQIAPVKVEVEKVVVKTDESPRRRWLWPVVGVGAAVVAGTVLAVVLSLTPHGTDYAANARSSCGVADCTLIDLGGGR